MAAPKEYIAQLNRDYTRLTTIGFRAKHGGTFEQVLLSWYKEARQEQINDDFLCYSTNLDVDESELIELRDHQLHELDRSLGA